MLRLWKPKSQATDHLMKNPANLRPFGQGTNTLSALGGEPRVHELVTHFYEIMSCREAYKPLWALHTHPRELAIAKLTAFLTGWMGGPRRYQEKFGSINIPGVHRHLPVDNQLAELWLACMDQALHATNVDEELRAYLLNQLSVPADRIVDICGRPAPE